MKLGRKKNKEGVKEERKIERRMKGTNKKETNLGK
jgi:hypothetical protein